MAVRSPIDSIVETKNIGNTIATTWKSIARGYRPISGMKNTSCVRSPDRSEELKSKAIPKPSISPKVMLPTRNQTTLDLEIKIVVASTTPDRIIILKPAPSKPPALSNSLTRFCKVVRTSVTREASQLFRRR